MGRGIRIIMIGLAAHAESYAVARRLSEAQSPGGFIIIDDLSRLTDELASTSVKEVNTLAESIKHRQVGRSEITMELTARELIETVKPIDLRKINEHPFEKFMSSKHKRKHRY